jgi:hypothetical protein
MSANPTTIRAIMFGMKYGKIMRASPQTSGTIAFCFLPYMKKPSPTEPNSTLQRSNDEFNAASYVSWPENSMAKSTDLRRQHFVVLHL